VIPGSRDGGSCARSESGRSNQSNRGRMDDLVRPARGGVVNAARWVSNLASGHLHDAGYERRPYPDWDVGLGETFVLSNVHVLDVDRGRLAEADHVVVVGDRIVELATSDQLASAPARYRSARELDGGGRFLVPGLSDIHCHVSLVTEFGVGTRQIRYLDGQRLRNVEAALESGCTFVRDCGGAVEQISHLRAEVEAGRLVGPRIVTSMNAISPRGGMWDVGRVMSKLAEPLFGGRYMRFPDGRDEVIAAMAEIDDSGCDFFKTYFEQRPLYGGDEDDVYAMFSPEEAMTIRATADQFGKPVSAHAMFLAGGRRAIDAGVDVVDHLTVDEPYGADDAERMATRGIAIVPTLSVGAFLAMNCGSRGYPDDPEVDFFAGQRTEHGRRHARHVAVPQLESNYERFFDWLDEPQERRKMPMIGPVWPTRVHGFARHAPTSIERLRAAGVKIGVGTDGGTGITFCGHLDTELAALHRYGFSNAEILRMATLGNMEIVDHADRLGSLEPGKLADMVLLEDNPLDHIDALGTVTAVIKGGRLCHGSL
jgi:imidazolonepropionase-like amidohydrolase